MDFDYGELKNDSVFIQKAENISTALDKIEKHLQSALEFEGYNDLSIQEKVKLDLYLAYSANSLFWMYLKLQGVDVNEHDIKFELSKVREAMLRDKQIHDRNTIRPTINKGAAERFIRHGLKIRKPKESLDASDSDSEQQNKRIKFDENASD